MHNPLFHDVPTPSARRSAGAPLTGATQRAAFTLVELLVVMAIVGILVAMLLPAVQAAREAGRKTECANHVKQLGLAFELHHHTHGQFPSAGWGLRWVGDPDRGAGTGQPGNWFYQILPFIEESELYQEGRDGEPDVITAEQKAGAVRMCQVPRSWMYCPSRFAPTVYPVREKLGSAFVNANTVHFAVLPIYGANWGDTLIQWHGGPMRFSPRRARIGLHSSVNRNTVTGIVFLQSVIRHRDVTDGLSKTYCVGEIGVNSNQYSGNYMVYEGSGNPYSMGWIVTTHYPPWQDRPEFPYINLFGGPHPGGWLVAMCDGSVQTIRYDIDPEIHRRLGNRADGLVVVR